MAITRRPYGQSMAIGRVRMLLGTKPAVDKSLTFRACKKQKEMENSIFVICEHFNLPGNIGYPGKELGECHLFAVEMTSREDGRIWAEIGHLFAEDYPHLPDNHPGHGKIPKLAICQYEKRM
jgi:hypothetical protein